MRLHMWPAAAQHLHRQPGKLFPGAVPSMGEVILLYRSPWRFSKIGPTLWIENENWEICILFIIQYYTLLFLYNYTCIENIYRRYALRKDVSHSRDSIDLFFVLSAHIWLPFTPKTFNYHYCEKSSFAVAAPQHLHRNYKLLKVRLLR